MNKILVVDDEQDICEILQFNLETEGYEVETANSAEEALMRDLASYDLILLDVMMGEISGFKMARMMKNDPKTAQVPIIFITALGDEDDTVKGLNIGADDYICKPLSIKEVKARVKAVLRRSSAKTQPQQKEEAQLPAVSEEPEIIRHDGIVMNIEQKTVTVDGEEVNFTKLEFELLALLMGNPGRVFSRDQILSRIWPKDTIVIDRTVDVNVTRIRKKIGEYGKCIKTKFGYGYLFER